MKNTARERYGGVVRRFTSQPGKTPTLREVYACCQVVDAFIQLGFNVSVQIKGIHENVMLDFLLESKEKRVYIIRILDPLIVLLSSKKQCFNTIDCFNLKEHLGHSRGVGEVTQSFLQYIERG